MASYVSQIKVGNNTAKIGLAERTNQLQYFITTTDAGTSVKNISLINGSTLDTSVNYSVGSVIALTFEKGNTVAVAQIKVGTDTTLPIFLNDESATGKFLENETALLLRTTNCWRILDRSNKWQTY